MSDNEKHWRERMATASFRGFKFLTDSHDAKGGKRLVVHEYPGSDEVLVEDLGSATWDHRLSAYFIGEDYDKERNGFLELLATAGADWLLHPWLGYLWVRPRSWSLHEGNDKGGFCSVSIEFVPGGAQPFTLQVDKVDQAIDRTRKLADAAVDNFALEPMSADGMTAFLAAVHAKLEVLRQVISLATLPLTMANQVRGLIAGVKGDMAALMALPSAYAAALRGLTNDLGAGHADISDTDRPRLIARMVSAVTAGSAVTVSGVAGADGAVRRNLRRESDLRSQLLVTAAAQIALADYRAEADRDAALAGTLAALDALLPSLPDAVFQAALAARAALIEALLAQDLKPASVRDVTGPIPAVVLAHRLGVDESMFLARNKVRHPLFVAGRVYG